MKIYESGRKIYGFSGRNIFSSSMYFFKEQRKIITSFKEK